MNSKRDVALRATPLNQGVRKPMPQPESLLESFLVQFHDKRPGGTSKSFSNCVVKGKFGSESSSYDLLAKSVPKNIPTSEILDLCCGDGYFLQAISNHLSRTHHLNGVDLSSGELRLAANKLGGRVNLIQARAQELPYRSNQFDYVFSHMALMLIENIRVVLDEILRVLKPKGLFSGIVGTAGVTSSAQRIFREAFSSSTRNKAFETIRFGPNPFRHEEQLRNALSENFEVVSIQLLRIDLVRSPGEMWSWFEEMYDVELIEEAERDTVRSRFLEAANKVMNSDGMLEHSVALRHFSAKAS